MSETVTFTARCPCGRTVTWTATRREIADSLTDRTKPVPDCACPIPAQRST